MTAQASDLLCLDDTEYAIAAIQRPWPFDPTQHGFSPVSPHTACWRGFIATYAVSDERLELAVLAVGFGKNQPHAWNGKTPQQGKFFKYDRMWEYQDVRLAIPYSGGLVVAAGFVREFYVHMGFHRPHCYEQVKELIFEDGLLLEQRDHSQRMAQARQMMRSSRKRDSGGQPPSSEEIEQFVSSAFSLSYGDKWA